MIITGIYINDKRLVIITSTKYICFNLSIKFSKSLKDEIKSITSRNESVAEYTIKARLDNHCSNIHIETIFVNRKNSSWKLLMKKNWVIY